MDFGGAMAPESKRPFSLKISEDISKAVGKMCDLERSTSTSYHQHFLIR